MTDEIDLEAKNANAEEIAASALQDERVLRALLEGIAPEARKTAVRENSFKTLLLLSERQPKVLFPHWKYLAGLLKSDNGFSKYAALYLIAALAPADDEGRFDKAFNTFYGLLDDESVMVASHIAKVSGKIAQAKPHLQDKITKRLLAIDKTHFDAERQGLVKGYAIAALDEYYAEAHDQAKILAFVRKQLSAASPKTRKAAKDFLKKWKGA
jgi:hypothetical protein